jgi:thioredoxin-related protein
MLKKSILLLLIFTLFATTLFSREIDLDKVFNQAKQDAKPVMIYLHRIGCSYCNSMDEFTLDDDKVIDFIKQHFTYENINITTDHNVTFKQKTMEGINFAKAMGYNFYPTVLFFENDGKVAYVSVGYKDEFEFLLILQYVQKKLYKRISFDEYKKAIGFQKNSNGEIIDTRK